MSHFRLTFAVLLVLAGTVPARPHELWIAPQSYMIDAGGQIIADIKVGDDFGGSTRPYLPFTLDRFDVTIDEETRPVNGRMGDMPALGMPAFGTGLSTVILVSKGNEVEYDDLESFTTFLASKGLEGILDQHRERGLPEANFREFYRRFSKCLIAVGEGAGSDRATGLETEIVAEANPYRDDISAGLPVRVLYQGRAYANADLQLFARNANADVTRTKLKTGADGRAMLPVTPGSEYLANAVVMRAAQSSSENGAPVWETLWASLTFKVPALR